MTHGPDHFIVYSSPASQWASVPLLGLVVKDYQPNTYQIQDVDLLNASNFDPSYLLINENGTIPALTAPSLSKPLMDTREILEWLNTTHKGHGSELEPVDEATKKGNEVIELVHSAQLNTNIILLQARDAKELEERKAVFRGYINKRQEVLEGNHANSPEHLFYAGKRKENAYLYDLYNNEVGEEHQAFFRDTHEAMKGFAHGMDALNELLVLPFAVGEELSYADLHVVPWLAHAMYFAGVRDTRDFDGLEKVLEKSVEGWRVGKKIIEWWDTMHGTDGFRKVFPKLH